MSAWDRLASWYRVLMQRCPHDVPRQVMSPYVLSLMILVAVLGFGVFEALHFSFG